MINKDEFELSFIFEIDILSIYTVQWNWIFEFSHHWRMTEREIYSPSTSHTTEEELTEYFEDDEKIKEKVENAQININKKIMDYANSVIEDFEE